MKIKVLHLDTRGRVQEVLEKSINEALDELKDHKIKGKPELYDTNKGFMLVIITYE